VFGLAVAAATSGSGTAGVVALVVAAAAVGVGTGLVTPLGFAHLVATTPPERLGQTMGAAEVGRELGDAGARCWSAPSRRRRRSGRAWPVWRSCWRWALPWWPVPAQS
jgi:hypothetical protein